MIFVTEYKVYNFSDRAGFVWGTVDIIDGDRLREFNEVEAVTLRIVSVDEFSRCSAVY